MISQRLVPSMLLTWSLLGMPRMDAKAGWNVVDDVSPGISIEMGLSYLPDYSYLDLTRGKTIGFTFQAMARNGPGIAPYFFYCTSTHRLKTLEPYSALLGEEDEHGFRVDPALRSELLNRSVKIGVYGVGLGLMVFQGEWIRPYLGFGIGGGAIKLGGDEAENRKLGSAGIAVHASVGVDLFVYKGFGIGTVLRVVHLFTDNPFDREMERGRGISLIGMSLEIKYWDQ